MTKPYKEDQRSSNTNTATETFENSKAVNKRRTLTKGK